MLLFIHLLCSSTLAMSWASFLGTAQPQPYDVVYYADGVSSDCFVVKVTDDSLHYRSIDQPDGEVYGESRENIVLIFKQNGDFLLLAEAGAQWKAGAHPAYTHIVTEESQVIAAHDIEEHEDIIYYHDALDSLEGSVRTDEVMVIIEQDGSHRLFTDVNDVAFALGGALAFALPADSAASNEAIASTESMAAPLKAAPPSEDENNLSEDASGSTSGTGGASGEVSSVARTADTPSERSGTATEELELSDADYQEFATKAINKAEYLNNYLSLLCNKTLDIFDKEQAKESALRLFVHDSTLVQVSSVNREEITTYKIDPYLEHLALLDYDKVELLWRNVQYVTKFRLAPDGNYYGTITVEQVFRGLRDGKAIYEDITQKDMEIVLGNFRTEENGITEYAWDVFLSDIGVKETRRL